MRKHYGIYDEKNMYNVIHLACGRGHYKPAIYDDVEEAIKICNRCNETRSKSVLCIENKYVIAEFDTIPMCVISIIDS